MKKLKPQSLNTLLKKQLKDPEFTREYHALDEEFALIKTIIDKRLEIGLTQAELAKKMETKQPSLARLESGRYNPSFKFLQRLAHAFNCQLEIKFVPLEKSGQKATPASLNQLNL